MIFMFVPIISHWRQAKQASERRYFGSRVNHKYFVKPHRGDISGGQPFKKKISPRWGFG
jgi:hypothetical protein